MVVLSSRILTRSPTGAPPLIQTGSGLHVFDSFDMVCDLSGQHTNKNPYIFRDRHVQTRSRLVKSIRSAMSQCFHLVWQTQPNVYG